MEIAWRQGRYTDSKENREAFTHLCRSRRGTVQVLLTKDCWEWNWNPSHPV